MSTITLLFFILLEFLILPFNIFSIMTYEEYKNINHEIPYFFKLTNSNQKLFYFGANHSCNPNNEQYPKLEKFWENFINETNGKNCIVLVEGSKRSIRKNKDDAIKSGEVSFITFLASQNNIQIECPEPNEQYLLNELLKEFSEEDIAYLNFSHGVQQFNRRKKIESNLVFETFIQPYFDYDQKFFNFSLKIENLEKIHKKIFNKEFDPNDKAFFDSITNPVKIDTIINKICRKASIIRDLHIVNYIESLIKQNKNIFIVYGCTHTIMQEKAVRKIFGMNNKENKNKVSSGRHKCSSIFN